MMSAPQLFSALSLLALLGWIVLAAGILFNKPLLRDRLAGLWIPVLLSLSYTAFMVFFFGAAEGGFDSLQNVQLLFTHPWVALAGWVHYLAFDLFIGAYIAREVSRLGLPRWPLLALLPLAFLAGPIGFLGFQILKTIKLADMQQESDNA